jgi:hypothetical protein
MSTAETGPDQSCVLKRTLHLHHTQPDGRVRILFTSWPSWPSCTLSCAKLKAASKCQLYQWLPNFVAIVRPVKMYTTSPPPNPSSQREVQFQVPTRLYGDIRNLKLSTASLHLKQATKCSCGGIPEPVKCLETVSIQPHFK